MAKITKEEFIEKAEEIVDNEPFGIWGKLFEYEDFEEMKVAYVPDGLGSSEADMPLEDFLDKLYDQIKENLK